MQYVGDQVSIQQDRAFRYACGATCVLQHGHIIGLDIRAFNSTPRAPGNSLIKAHSTGQAVGGNELLLVAHHVVDQRTLQQAQLVSHGTENHMFDLCCSNAFFQSCRKVLQNNDGLGAGVFQLVLQLAWCVQRIDVHQHQAGAQNGCDGNGVLRHVGHHDGDAVALDQTQALQVGGKGLAEAVSLGVSSVLAHETVRNPLGVFLEAFFHQRHH